MAQEWYYTKDGQRQGPITSKQLRELAASGELLPTDLLWTEGKDEWKSASIVKGLFPKESADTQTPQTATADQSNFTSQLLDGSKYAAAIGTVSGLVSDFLSPLAPINGYLFVLLTLFTAFLVFRWYKLEKSSRHRWDRKFPHQTLIFCATLQIAFGIWFVIEASSDSQGRGVLAANIGPIKRLQDTLLSISADVVEIKKDTTQILTETKRIGKNVEELGKLGGLVTNPQTPHDFYHNARIHELSGKFTGAFAAYEKYISFGEEFVDPYLSYLQLLRTQRGHEAAKRQFTKLEQTLPSNLALKFVSLRLLSGETRLATLQTFAQQHREFGPATLDLANYFSAAETPNRSGVDAEKELRYLKQFVEIAEAGDFIRFYIDKNKANQLLADARGRLTSVDRPGGIMETNRKVFLANRNQVWVMESTATNILYSFDKAKWKPVTNLVKTIMLRRGTIDDKRLYDGSHEIVFVKYRDHRGNDSQVYSLAISSANELSAPKNLGQPIDPSRFTGGKSPDDLLRKQRNKVNEILKSLPKR